MSAVAGILHTDGSPIDQSRLRTVANPPHDRAGHINVWVNGHVGFAHTDSFRSNNLSNEQQPLFDSASGCTVTSDGRLDNRAELSGALADYHRLLDCKTDAAFILASYLQWGKDCIYHLLGDFALAIWDARLQQLFIARDPLGQRSLFYSHTKTQIIFASTLEQLLQDRAIPREYDETILPRYLYTAGAVRQESPYRTIKRLPGGSYLTVDSQQLKVEDYWRWQEEPPKSFAVTENDVEEFRALFADAVRCRLSCDTPIGLLLSGGLDSGSVASMAGDLHLQNGSPLVHTYSFVFDKFSECDEREYIDSVVSRYGFPHTPVPVDDCWTLSRLDPWLSVFSEPFFAPYDPMFYKTLEHARADGIRVMLMGHGGDILLDGSARYLADWLLAGRWHQVHRQTRAYATSSKRPYLVGLIGNAFSPLFPTQMRRVIEFRDWPRIDNLIPQHLRSLDLDALPTLHRGRNAWWYDFRDQLNFGQTPYEDYLDRLMRLFGMEIRQPFLDVRLVKLVLRLPPDAMYSSGTHRAIIRSSLSGILPPQIRERKGKASFGPLMDYGLHARQKFVEALLHESELVRRGLIVEKAWVRGIQNYFARHERLDNVYWRSLVMEIWLRTQTGRLPELS